MLVSTSCHQRLDTFVAAESHEAADADVRAVCLEHCDWDSIRVSSTLVDGDSVARPRPWLQRSQAGPNFEPGAASEALACIGQVGVAGCAAESPLGAALRALERMQDPHDPSFGFVRPDAGLAIVFIGDEDDCSRPQGAVEPLDRDGQTLSAACWSASATTF